MSGAALGRRAPPAVPPPSRTRVERWCQRCERSGDAGRPAVAVEAHAEHGEAGQVDGGGSGVDVGGDAGDAATSGFAAAPQAPGEVGDLAFHHRPVGPVALSPLGDGLLAAGRLQQSFVTVDGDRAAPASRGAALV